MSSAEAHAKRAPLSLAVCLLMTGCADEALRVDHAEAYPGGETTNFLLLGVNAYAQPLANLEGDRRNDFHSGNTFFNQAWVEAPASTTARDGLGPTFNAESCSDCHFKDGRGRPPLDAMESMNSMLVRISVPGTDTHGGPLGDTNYGGQIQPIGVGGAAGEAEVIIDWTETAGEYADGTAYSLRSPTYRIESLAFGPLDEDIMLSGRVAPPVFGLGLLTAVEESVLLEYEDADDVDGDGISGRANHVWDVEAGALAMGRFGWKAGQPSIRQQTAGAFRGDIGITSDIFPDENCPMVQLDCGAAASGGMPEIDAERLRKTVFYGLTLAPPAREGYGREQVMHGRELMRDIGCVDCHRETMTTGDYPEIPELSFQEIRPFTDLLLHDMGEDLADGRPVFDASGNEWRTPPLWGIGRTEEVNAHTFFLHDGRARSLEEAILWHGGEAEESKELFRDLSVEDREALLAFLENL